MRPLKFPSGGAKLSGNFATRWNTGASVRPWNWPSNSAVLIMSKKVIELIRVSTESQAADDRASIPAQRTINRRTARTHDLEIVHSIEYWDVSGAAVLASPEIQDLIRRIGSPEIHGVIAREFSRLMRTENLCDFALLQHFADTKTLLYLQDGPPIDFTSKTGRFFGTMQAAMAGMQRLEFLENVWASKEEKRRAGKFPSSHVCLPFGVGYEDGRGWFYTPEAEKMREAFRLVLSGETCYVTVGRKLGIDPCSLKVMLRNPVYTGWRVIDKRRDPSAGAKRVKPGGRQGDRPKIARAPDEIIRVRVLDEPLVSEEEFLRAQQIMEIKRKRHWKARPDFQHRFTYNGFLTCAACGEPIQTGVMRDDYYVCRGKRKLKKCDSGYMRRDTLDPGIDSLFAKQLTDPAFLSELAAGVARRQEDSGDSARAARIEDEIVRLGAKRGRVLESYFEGVIDRAERDSRLEAIDRDLERAREMLERDRPRAGLDAESLASFFSPFFEWEFLQRDDKRRVLSTVVPEIHVADHRVDGISITFPLDRSINESHKGKDSSRRRA
jgi:DNA invertase Pin-like site-specific DNA recombinase